MDDKSLRTQEVQNQEEIFYDRLIKLNRVTKAVKGGRRFAFGALVVIGNKKGFVGFGQGKANDVAEAIRKANSRAKKNLLKIVVSKSTLPYQVIGKYKSSRVVMRPAAPGTGIIAGGAVRVIMDLSGIKDTLCKTLGSRNPVNVVKAAFDGLNQLQSISSLANSRDKSVDNIWK